MRILMCCYLSPSINDICKNKRNKQRHNSHYAKRERTAAAVGYSKTALQVV